MRHKICLLMLLAVISGCNQSPPKTETQAEVSEDSISTFDALNAELTATKEALAKAEADKTALAATVQTRDATIADLTAERDQAHSDIASYIVQIDDLETKIERVDQEIKDKKQEIDDLKNLLAIAPTEAEKTSLTEQLATAGTDLTAMTGKRDDLQRQLDQALADKTQAIAARDTANTKLLEFAQKVCR